MNKHVLPDDQTCFTRGVPSRRPWQVCVCDDAFPQLIKRLATTLKEFVCSEPFSWIIKNAKCDDVLKEKQGNLAVIAKHAVLDLICVRTLRINNTRQQTRASAQESIVALQQDPAEPLRKEFMVEWVNADLFLEASK